MGLTNAFAKNDNEATREILILEFIMPRNPVLRIKKSMRGLTLDLSIRQQAMAIAIGMVVPLDLRQRPQCAKTKSTATIDVVEVFP